MENIIPYIINACVFGAIGGLAGSLGCSWRGWQFWCFMGGLAIVYFNGAIFAS